MNKNKYCPDCGTFLIDDSYWAYCTSCEVTMCRHRGVKQIEALRIQRRNQIRTIGWLVLIILGFIASTAVWILA